MFDVFRRSLLQTKLFPHTKLPLRTPDYSVYDMVILISLETLICRESDLAASM